MAIIATIIEQFRIGCLSLMEKNSKATLNCQIGLRVNLEINFRRSMA